MSPSPSPLFFEQSRARIDAYLAKMLPTESVVPGRLHEAMRYAVLGGGKRIRPALAFAAALALDEEADAVLPVAAAVELVHAYSLVHDDLPAMDDDDERRGRATVHRKFGEALAILAGDALLAEAFMELARARVPIEVVGALAQAAGCRALVGGQVDDLAFGTAPAELAEVVSIHTRKTAALFRFSVLGAGMVVAASTPRLEALARFGECFGRGFQLVDDLLDAAAEECSILCVLSAEKARARADEEIRQALGALEIFGPSADQLRDVAKELAGRLT